MGNNTQTTDAPLKWKWSNIQNPNSTVFQDKVKANWNILQQSSKSAYGGSSKNASEIINQAEKILSFIGKKTKDIEDEELNEAEKNIHEKIRKKANNILLSGEKSGTLGGKMYKISDKGGLVYTKKGEAFNLLAQTMSDMKKEMNKEKLEYKNKKIFFDELYNNFEKILKGKSKMVNREGVDKLKRLIDELRNDESIGKNGNITQKEMNKILRKMISGYRGYGNYLLNNASEGGFLFEKLLKETFMLVLEEADKKAMDKIDNGIKNEVAILGTARNNLSTDFSFSSSLVIDENSKQKSNCSYVEFTDGFDNKHVKISRGGDGKIDVSFNLNNSPIDISAKSYSPQSGELKPTLASDHSLDQVLALTYGQDSYLFIANIFAAHVYKGEEKGEIKNIVDRNALYVRKAAAIAGAAGTFGELYVKGNGIGKKDMANLLIVQDNSTGMIYTKTIYEVCNDIVFSESQKNNLKFKGTSNDYQFISKTFNINEGAWTYNNRKLQDTKEQRNLELIRAINNVSFDLHYSINLTK